MNLKIRELREKLGMSQREFSEHTCIARSYLQELEHPESNTSPTICKLCMMAHRLKIPVTELYDCDP